MLEHPALRERLAQVRHRLLSIELIDPPVKNERMAPPDAYRATIYDYTHNRAILVGGSLHAPDDATVEESGLQPLPSNEEFDEAVAIVRRDPQLGAALQAGRVQTYPPMPPLVQEQLPHGGSARVITVGLRPRDPQIRPEIVGVDMGAEAIVRYPNGAPTGSLVADTLCGQPDAGQPPTNRGVAGAARVTVSRGSTVLWTFVVVRPSASSGTYGSAVELRYVDYLGKRVLYQAHVPILNVLYDGNACGPYRDWQYAESPFQAIGTDVAPGFRQCPTPATTILDTGSDTGTFQGVAIYIQGEEVVLVSELQAGWYRYVSQWRLRADGTISPRFGFAATQNPCVCHRHHHHAYWRLDFDIATAGNNQVQEFNHPFLIGQANWHSIAFETKRARNSLTQRHWRVVNATSGAGYDIIPGPNDGVADAYAHGDVWVLRYRGMEIDDGNPTGTDAHLDQFTNGESVANADVVLWYGAHFTHDVEHEHSGMPDHIVGPTLRPANW